MDKLRLYNVSDEYINFLRNFDKRVFSNKEEDRCKERKYLGIVLSINNFNYFVPLSSPKDSDYLYIENVKTIRKSIIPIMRIVAEGENGNDELKGTLKFSNMIPIPYSALLDYDLENEPDENYKILVLKELSFIFSNKKTIIRNAKVIHNQKTKNMNNIGYIKDTVNFKLLEQKCIEYEALQQIKDTKDTASPIEE